MSVILQWWKKLMWSYGWKKKSPYLSSYSRTMIPWYQWGSFHKRKTALENNFPTFWRRLLVSCIAAPIIIVGIWLYANVLKDLPNIKSIEDKWFKQATTITARDGEVLYKLYEENREYVPFENISKNFVNAIISIEDQRFWTNPGIDVYGITRAIIRDIRTWAWHGASTITQQLIKNMLLTSERKISRKLKELILAMQLNSYIEKDINKKYNNLSQKETDRKVKEKVMELYANYIFFGNNAYGIETAAKTYFAKSAKDLNILESSILASLPKAPTSYDPYTNKDALVGELYMNPKEEKELSDEELLTAKSWIYGKIEAELQKSSFSSKSDEWDIVNYLTSLLSFSYQSSGVNFEVKYSPGRKDYVLTRMYSDRVITEKEFKDAFFAWLDVQFQRSSSNILAPHFVFWVINQLEKQFDPDVLRKGWLTIKTTLDMKTQGLAESSITEQDASVKSYGASNSSMLYVDSRNGDILAYVWSKDYYNKTIGGENDLVQRARQPWSTIKPLLYALGFIKLPLTIDSPIYDIPMTIAGNKPANADGKFNGLMSIKAALAASRNLPAIKMFLMVGGENPFKEFLQKLWVSSLTMDKEIYGYPLAIGAGEIPLFQMVQAYTHLSAWGKPAKLNPILEINGPNGDVLYKKKVEEEISVIPPGVAYLLWRILSDMDNMPAAWRKTFDFPAIKFATKSGTTNVVIGEKKLPRDGWFVAYTPSKVMMFWAGNNDSKPLKENAYGWWINAPIRRSFSNKLVKNKLITNEAMDEMEVKKVSVSKLSGKLASSSTPLALIANSLSFISTSPTQYDPGARRIQLDRLCNGRVSAATLSGDIVDAYIISPSSIMPDKRDQSDIMNRWAGWWLSVYSQQVGRQLYLSDKNIWASCSGERSLISAMWEISLNIVQPTPGQQVSHSFSVWHQTKSPFPVKSVTFYLNNVELKTSAYTTPTVIDISTISIPESMTQWSYTLKVVATDEKWFSDSKSVPITIGEKTKDTNPPYILKDKIQVSKKISGTGDEQKTIFTVTALFADDSSTIKQGTIWQNWQQIANFSKNLVAFTTTSLSDISYVVIDESDNKWTGIITVSSP